MPGASTLTATVLASGVTSANIGVPIIGALVVVVLVGGVLFIVLRKR